MPEWLKIALPALITLAGTILTVLLTASKQSAVLECEVKHLKEDMGKMESNLKEDIKRLETKQDRYNNLQERTAAVESSVKSAHHRLDSLENKVA